MKKYPKKAKAFTAKTKIYNIYDLCHIFVKKKTVGSPSCAGLKEPAASWQTPFDNEVVKMVIIVK